MRVAVTGVQGYVGSAIAEGLQAAGHDVVALSRRPSERYDWRPYDLSQPVQADLLADVNAVVHCAYDLSLTGAPDITRVNVHGTRALVQASQASSSRIHLISSMSAYEGTRQLYGRAKLACEADVLSVGGNAIRLGLVYGGGDGGMIGSLRRIAGLPVIPVIGRSSHQFMVHVADMASAMVRLVERAEIGSETAGLAHPEPVRFDALLRALAAVKGRQPTLVPLPWQPIYGAMRVAESLRLPLPLRADSVLGLVRPAPGVPNLELWDRLGVTLRPLELD